MVPIGQSITMLNKIVNIQAIVLIHYLKEKYFKFLRSNQRTQTKIFKMEIFHENTSRSIRSQMSFKIGVLKNFAIFTGKHQCWSLFFNKVACLQAFIKKRLQHWCFRVNIAKFFRTAFFIEHLLLLLL